jgi:hypothetical protein
LPAGRHRVVVRVRDLETGAEAESERELRVDEAEES